ncbi:ALP1-like protein isoform X2 [Tanacetum coccineum]
MNEILNGNHMRCVNAFRMHPIVFINLCEELESKYELKSSDRMSVVEELGDCIGCIDGTHIGACILENQQGSAHDTRVFLHALNTSSPNFPKPPRGKYYLVDKGYPDRNGYLVPYSKTRYHQSQFENEPPNNKQEAFNRKHSSLRSYIERSFGVLKKRWKILGRIPKFSVQTQIDVIIVAFTLHNYIRNSSQEDMMFTVMEQHPDYIPQDELHDVRNHDTNNEDNSGGASNEMKQIRNDIATLIWNACQAESLIGMKTHQLLFQLELLEKKHAQSRRFGSITANNDDDNDDNDYKEKTVNHLSCKTLSSALDDVHQKGTLIDRVAMLENRVLQLSLDMDEGSTSRSSSSTAYATKEIITSLALVQDLMLKSFGNSNRLKSSTAPAITSHRRNHNHETDPLAHLFLEREEERSRERAERGVVCVNGEVVGFMDSEKNREMNTYEGGRWVGIK